MNAQTFQASHDIALQIAVAAMERANAVEGDDPISGHQFRDIQEKARRIVARMNLRIADLAGAEVRHD